MLTLPVLLNIDDIECLHRKLVIMCLNWSTRSQHVSSLKKTPGCRHTAFIASLVRERRKVPRIAGVLALEHQEEGIHPF